MMNLFDFSTETRNVYSDLCSIIVNKRIPINASIFITNNCNFRCRHCYVQSIKNKNENPLAISDWKTLLRELKDNGCLFLTISGGEPLCHPDFLDFYLFAYNLNFQITLISNLSLLNDKHIETFSLKKPHKIIVSLYGFSEKTYTAFCGVSGKFHTIMSNIDTLQKHGVTVELQTVVNVVNYNEIKLMYDYAKQKKIVMHFFRNITCEIDGNSQPLDYKITIKQELKSYDILQDKEIVIKSFDNNKIMWRDGYKRCFAGLTNCYIDYQGNMFLCNHVQNKKVSTKNKGFVQCWDDIYSLRKEYIEKSNPCSYCKKRTICGKCTPVFDNMIKKTAFPFQECNDTDFLINELRLEI